MHSLREETTRPVSLKDWRTSAFYLLRDGETQTFAGSWGRDREKESEREGSKVKTTGQIISVFQRGKGFPFASWKDRNRKHLERRSCSERGKVRSERGNNGVGGNRFKAAVSAEND